MRSLLFVLLASLSLVVGCATSAQRSGDVRPINLPAAPDLVSVQRQRLPVPIAPVRNPAAKSLKFSLEQRQVIRGTLLPGDVLLTYTAGVSSNLVVPGRFKHALVYVGSQADSSGDVIEAISQGGVVLSRLEDLLATRVNRMVALRPLLSEKERTAYLQEVLSYRGQSYDFAVDFHDPTRKVCTEVVYCALQGRDGLEFPLVKRAGRAVLISDDIVAMHLKRSTSRTGFECVLLADRNPKQAGCARLLLGAEGAQQLKRIMKVPLDDEPSSRCLAIEDPQSAASADRL